MILDELKSQTSTTVGVMQSATTFISGVSELIQAAIVKALNGGATAAQLEPFTDLASAMKVETDNLAGAIVTENAELGNVVTEPVIDPVVDEPVDDSGSTSSRKRSR